MGEMFDPLLIMCDYIIMSRAHGGRLVKLAGLVTVIDVFGNIPLMILIEGIKVEIFGRIRQIIGKGFICRLFSR